MGIEINGANNPRVNDSANVDRKNEQAKTASGKTDENLKNSVASDSINLNPSSVIINELENSIGKTAEIDQKRVDAIKTAIASGDYNINPEKIAQKLSSLEALLP